MSHGLHVIWRQVCTDAAEQMPLPAWLGLSHDSCAERFHTFPAVFHDGSTTQYVHACSHVAFYQQTTQNVRLSTATTAIWLRLSAAMSTKGLARDGQLEAAQLHKVAKSV